MNKSQFYLSQCVEAASKSTMYYTLGSAIVKGGKVVSTGFNHQRPNYDSVGKGMPPSMHAEMACIFNATRGRAPAQKQQRKGQQQQNKNRAVRKNEEQRRDLDSRRTASPVSYERPHRRTFYPSRQYQYHHEYQEGEPASESDGAGARGAARKQSRARNSRLNGADLYVCRVTKAGQFGSAHPCWRCVEWCAWAGIRRIFHWSMAEGRFICLKVAGAVEEECYLTVTDFRFLTGRP
ncbi:hypothetical protein B0H11DRAFT_2286416 [Mycena galericulata]|nr:hypothetical protein B0H11DRAFT_2286416 [Mycena galericulata]